MGRCNGDVTHTATEACADAVPKTPKSAVLSGDDLDDKLKPPVIQLKGRFRVTSGSVDKDKDKVLLTRLLYIGDPGYPYATTLKLCLDMARSIMCSYISPPNWFGMVSSTSPGGLIFPSVVSKALLSFAATAAFLSKLYGDYLDLIQVAGGSCGARSFSPEALKSFARSQVNYILGDNPMKMSYVVGFRDRYLKQVHHRGASIPRDGRHYGCADGKRWRESKDPNPNVLLGAMVAGPGQDDRFFDQRDQPKYTEATIAGNAGFVAALVALLDEENSVNGGIDRDGIFTNIS